jgi:hypothetical protein
MNFSPITSFTPSGMCPFSIFCTFEIKSVAPFGASATPMRYYCTCRYVRSCFEQRFHEANHPKALCF